MFGSLRQYSALSVLALAACGTPASPETPASPDIATSSMVDAAAPANAPADASVDAATTAAKAWLGLVDAEKYAESWSGAAQGFQSAISSDNWSRAVGDARHPLGKLLSRQLKSAEFKTSLPGVPDGKYVVIQFASAFENRAQAVETITPSQEADGSWKVSGYFIK